MLDPGEGGLKKGPWTLVSCFRVRRLVVRTLLVAGFLGAVGWWSMSMAAAHVPTFAGSEVSTDTNVTYGLAVGDVNRDGSPDMVFANYGARNRLCVGDGAGGFTCSDVSTDTNDSLRVAVADVNRDGNPDVVFANSNQVNRVCAGDGSGGFTCSDVSTAANDSYGVAVADINSDGNPDIVFANYVQRNRVCAGDGSGGFTCSDVATDTNNSLGVAVGDVNSDGNPDIVFANTMQRNRVCAGDGSGGFTCSDVATDTNNSLGVVVADVNRDGNPDVVFTNNGVNRVCAGDGSGSFTCSDVSADVNTSRGVAVADVNRDGNPDIVFASDGVNRVCTGDGSGGFTCSDVSTAANNSLEVAVADVNSDGNPDTVFANIAANRVELQAPVFPNHVATFTGSDVSPDVNATWGMVVADVNSDGNPDMVFANTGANRLCVGDGSGGFTCSAVSTDTNSTNAVAVADVNSDGSPDMVFANSGVNRLCVGDGSGGFTCSDVSTDANSTDAVAVADVNRDGSPDVVFANYGQVNRLCVGDGSGGFTCSNVSTDANSTGAVAVADVNSDGNPDVVFANFGEVNRVCWGDGAGGFTCSNVSADTNSNLAVAVADVNRDGDPDVVFANGNQVNRLCTGDGSGGFTCSDVSTDTNNSWGVAVVDVNLDGNPDVVFANRSQRNRVFSQHDLVVVTTRGSGAVTSDVGSVNCPANSDPFTTTSCFDHYDDGTSVVLTVTPDPGWGFVGWSGDATGTSTATTIDTTTNKAVTATFQQLATINLTKTVDGGDGTFSYTATTAAGGSGLPAVFQIDSATAGPQQSFAVVPGFEYTITETDPGTDPGGWRFADLSCSAGMVDQATRTLTVTPGAGAVVACTFHNQQLATITIAKAVDGDDGTFGFSGDLGGFSITTVGGTGRRVFTDLLPGTYGVTETVPAGYRLIGVGGDCASDPPTGTVTVTVAAGQALTCTFSNRGEVSLRFVDIAGSVFEGDILWLADQGITKGCNPPADDRFCPDGFVTRGQMAAFLVRAMGYTDDGGGDRFVDDDGSVFEGDIDRLGTAGVTRSCNPPADDRFCPDGFVTRGQMAAFLHRALG